MIEPERTLEEAVSLMAEKGIRRLPVLNYEKIIGIVARALAGISRSVGRPMIDPL